MLLPGETISGKIIILRGEKVILDSDLAILYGRENKYLKRQVKRNSNRFPSDFIFQLTKSEKAIQVNIAIMRMFTHMRTHLEVHKELKRLVLENQEEIQNIRFELQKIFSRR